jgi:apolipoprotein N-acyltransferase
MATNQTQQPRPDEPTIGRLIKDAQTDLSTLIRKEIQLAKSEIKVSATAGGAGIGMLLGAAFILVLAIIMLSVAIAYFIHWNGDGLALQWAFLIVFGAYLLLAALLAYLGVRKFKKVKAPEKAIAQGREIPQALKGGHTEQAPAAQEE